MAMILGHISFISIFVHSFFNIWITDCDKARLYLALGPYVLEGVRTFIRVVTKTDWDIDELQTCAKLRDHNFHLHLVLLKLEY